MMPLTTSYAELDEGIDILARSLAEELGAGRGPTVVRSSHAPDLKILA